MIFFGPDHFIFLHCKRHTGRKQAWDEDSPLVLNDEDEDFQTCEAEDDDSILRWTIRDALHTHAPL